MLKVGLIRCRQTEDMCPGNTDFKIAREGTMVFEETGPVEIVGLLSCGGCPGKNAGRRAKLIVERGAEAIVICSCISRGNPIGFPCPNFESIRDSVRKAVGPDIKVFEYTH